MGKQLSGQLFALKDTGWTKYTVISFLTHMEKKGAIRHEEGGNVEKSPDAASVSAGLPASSALGTVVSLSGEEFKWWNEEFFVPKSLLWQQFCAAAAPSQWESFPIGKSISRAKSRERQKSRLIWT